MDTSWDVGPCSYFPGLSPGKQPFLALDSITMPDFNFCASPYELFFLCKNPTAANLPERRFPIKKASKVICKLAISLRQGKTVQIGKRREVLWSLDWGGESRAGQIEFFFPQKNRRSVMTRSSWKLDCATPSEVGMRDLPSHYQLIKGSLRYVLCPTHQVCVTTSETLTDS